MTKQSNQKSSKSAPTETKVVEETKVVTPPQETKVVESGDTALFNSTTPEAPSEDISVPASSIKTELTESQKVSLDIFKSYISEYEDSRESINPTVETRDKGYAVLHGAIRHLVGLEDGVAQAACFHYLVTRIANLDGIPKLKNAYAMPTLIGNLSDYSEIKIPAERVFQAEFLTSIRKYALQKDKGNFASVTPIHRVLSAIKNDKSRKNLLACFGG